MPFYLQICRKVATVSSHFSNKYVNFRESHVALSHYPLSFFVSFLARDVSKYIHLALMLRCQCLSVYLSVTEVHWRIITNLGFKFRSQFTAHCGRGACGREH